VTGVLRRVSERIKEAWVSRETASRPRLNDPNWYRGHYLLAVAFANVAQAQDEDSSLEVPDDLRSARKQAQGHVRSVALSLEFNLDDLRRRRLLRARERALAEFLEALEPTVLLLLAGTIRRWGSPVNQSEGFSRDILGRRSLVDALERNALRHGDIIEYVRGLRLDYRARYNLACYYAGRGDDERPEASGTEHGTSEGDDEIATSTGDDPERRGEERVPVEGRCRPKYKPPPGYVHAFSELAEALKTAPADVVEWAQNDPSLAGLRDDEELGPRLKKLIKELTPAKEAPRKIPGSPMNARPQ
jgi:hypothetical protein